MEGVEVDGVGLGRPRVTSPTDLMGYLGLRTSHDLVDRKEALLQRAERSDDESLVSMARFLRRVEEEVQADGLHPIVFNRLLLDGNAHGVLGIHPLHNLPQIMWGQGVDMNGVHLELSFDLDTLEVETASLSTFFAVTLLIQRDNMSVRDEYSTRTRGRHLVHADDEANFRVSSALEVGGAERQSMTGYGARRRIGCLESNFKHPLFMYQTHTDLDTSSKWVAWEIVYEYVAWVVRGLCPHRLGRQSSATSPATRHGLGVEYSVGVATMSSSQSEELMKNLADLEIATLYFEAVYENVLADYERRTEENGYQQEGDDQQEEEERPARYHRLWLLLHEVEEGLLEDGPGRRWDHAVHEETRDYFVSMLKRLRFYGLYQLSRVGAGSIMLPMQSVVENAVDSATYATEVASIQSELVTHIARLVDLRKVGQAPRVFQGMRRPALDVASTEVLLFPHIAMELRVVRRHEEEGGPRVHHTIFKAPVPGDDPPEPIRLHLDKGAFKEEVRRWKNILSAREEGGEGTCPVTEVSGYYACWGNDAMDSGPAGFKGIFAQKPGHPTVNLAAVGPHLPPLARCMVPQPIPGRGAETLPYSNILCIYETTCRASSARKTAAQQAKLVKKMTEMVEFQTTAERKVRLLGEVVQDMKDSINRLLDHFPSPDTPLRFEVAGACALCPTTGGNFMDTLESSSGDVVNSLLGTDFGGILGFSMHEEFPSLSRSLVPWLDVLEHVASRQVRGPAGQALGTYAAFAPKLVDYLATCYGMLTHMLEGEYLGDNSNIFLASFGTCQGRPIRASMKAFGFPVVPPEMIQMRPCALVDGEGVPLPVPFPDSFVSRWLLRSVYGERRGARNFAKMIKYSSRMLQDVMLICPPQMYHHVLEEYMSLAVLENLGTSDYNFQIAFAIDEERFGYRILGVHFGGLDIGRRVGRNWPFPADGSNCRHVLSLIGEMAQTAGIPMDSMTEYTVEGGVYGFANLVEQDVNKRQGQTGRPDQTLYMNAWRSYLFALQNIGYAEEDMTVVISAVLTPPILDNHRGLFAHLHREGQATEAITIRKMRRPSQAMTMQLRMQIERMVGRMDGQYCEYLGRSLGLPPNQERTAIQDAKEEAGAMAEYIQKRHVTEYLRSLHARYPEKFLLEQ